MIKSEMTRGLELAYIHAAKLGYEKAIEMLYDAYAEDLEKAHRHSGMGEYPQVFGYGHNPKGETYESYGGEVYKVFRKAVLDFNPEEASETADLPLLKYACDAIGHRAQDAVRRQSLHGERFITFNALHERTRQSLGFKADEKLTDEEVAQYEGDIGNMYLNEKQELREKELNRTVDHAIQKVRELGKKGETAYNFLTEYRKVLHERIKKTGAMGELAKRLGEKAKKRAAEETAPMVTKRKTKSNGRTAMYHPLKKAKAAMPPEVLDMLHDAISETD